MNFDPLIEAQLAGRIARFGTLVELEFASETVRLWNGVRLLPTLDGKTWLGSGALGEITGLEDSADGSAPEARFSLSGVDETFLAVAAGSRSEYADQPAVVYVQAFDDAWQVIGEPIAVAYRHMDTFAASRADTDEGWLHTATVTAETPLVTRRRPPGGHYTDAAQKLISPGDRGLERVAGIDNKTIEFPSY